MQVHDSCGTAMVMVVASNVGGDKLYVCMQPPRLQVACLHIHVHGSYGTALTTLGAGHMKRSGWHSLWNRHGLVTTTILFLLKQRCKSNSSER